MSVGSRGRRNTSIFWQRWSVQDGLSSTHLFHGPNVKRLLVTIKSGKTGFKIAIKMAGAVNAYELLGRRYLDAGGDDD